MPPSRHSDYYCDGFEAPSPAKIEAIRRNVGATHMWAGVTVVRLSRDMAVKFGAHVSIAEAKSVLFVARNTKHVPVPKIFGYYVFGPHERDAEDFGSLHDSYIFESFADGETPEKGWETYKTATKIDIAAQPERCFTELREVPSPPWLGSIDGAELRDVLFDRVENKGPLNSEEDFNNALLDTCQKSSPGAHIRSFLNGMLVQQKHRTCFTHGDLRPANVIAKSALITGIVDWEFSGWYPEYWEFARAFHPWRWQSDWTDYLLTILSPYYAEYGEYLLLGQRIGI